MIWLRMASRGAKLYQHHNERVTGITNRFWTMFQQKQLWPCKGFLPVFRILYTGLGVSKRPRVTAMII